MTPAAFAIPGDIDTPTGGFRYERRLLEALRGLGREVRHIMLPGSFPDPSPADTDATVAALRAVPPGRPVILDGFLSGALDPDRFAEIRAPTVAVVHHPLALEQGLPPERAAWLRRTETANLSRTSHVIVPSPHTKSILTGEYAVPSDRISVVRPGVDRPKGVAMPEEPPLLLSVGILHPRKGHDVLVAALGRLIELDWRAVIVGAAWDEAFAAALAEQVAREGLSGRVTMAGRVGPSELHRLYRSARIFALATRYEGYGLVFDEALAAGLPIVSCTAGAVPQTVPADAGLLVPPGDPDAFAAALRRIMTDGAVHRQLSEAAARRGAALPDWSGAARDVGAILDRITAAG